MIKLLTLISCIALLIACGNSSKENDTASDNQKQEQKMPVISNADNNDVNSKQTAQTLYIAKVKHFSMEGGFYGLITKDGKHFLPMNLAKEFRQDGAVIEFSGEVVTDIMTIQQWGTPFKLNGVKLIKAGKKQTNPHL